MRNANVHSNTEKGFPKLQRTRQNMAQKQKPIAHNTTEQHILILKPDSKFITLIKTCHQQIV